MGVLLKLFSIQRNHYAFSKKENFIFYKIIDAINDNQKLVLQCINTSSIFQIDLTEIVFDIDILYALHPIQACYVGLEYSNINKQSLISPKNQKAYENKIKKYSEHRYGKYKILAHDRKANIKFANITTNEEFTMDPQDMAFCEEIISEFDAQQAFHIGLTAGLKIAKLEIYNHHPLNFSFPHLRLIK